MPLASVGGAFARSPLRGFPVAAHGADSACMTVAVRRSVRLDVPRSAPVSRRGIHWRLRPLAVTVFLSLASVGSLAVVLGSPRTVLFAPGVAGMAVTLVLRRREQVVGPVLHVRRLRHRSVLLPDVTEAWLRSVPALGCRAVQLVLVDLSGRRVAVPVWRTRSPRGVDAHACDTLADELLRAPADLVALLRAQGEAVRTGHRPTPLDRLPSARRRTAAPDPATSSTAAPDVRPPASQRPEGPLLALDTEATGTSTASGS